MSGMVDETVWTQLIQVRYYLVRLAADIFMSCYRFINTYTHCSSSSTSKCHNLSESHRTHGSDRMID